MFTFDLFLPDCLKIRLIGVPEEAGVPCVNVCHVGIWRKPTKRDTPPIWGATSALYPHNFSHQKYSKKSPWQIGKNFGKNLQENVSGKKKAPNLVERGQGVLKYERIDFVGKDSGIIRECKMRVLSFCFRTIEPCLCLVGRCLYDLLSFGT